jgi:hypothetical protein
MERLIMPIINQTAGVAEISSGFGMLIGMIVAGIILIIFVYIISQVFKQ